jgi:DNA polymerase-3 subunit delta'
MDFMKADRLPWLGVAQQQMRDSRAARRLPHSCLISSTPGLGAEYFANWLSALALCEGEPVRPCGICASCRLLQSASHPDYHLVKIEEDKKQISVDQVRELISSLALKSYRGGYKVGVIEGAEALNANGANAFLKTLEEPSSDTLLMLVTRPNHRLPATIASRCVRLTLRPPAREEAVTWLKQHAPAAQNLSTALDLAGGAPLLAFELLDSGIDALEADMQASMRALSSGQGDVTVLADAWARSNLPLRVTWLENWITRRVHNYLGDPDLTQTAERVRLPAALLKAKIRALFELLDATRELRRLASTGMNQQLALEALLLGGRTALAN